MIEIFERISHLLNENIAKNKCFHCPDKLFKEYNNSGKLSHWIFPMFCLLNLNYVTQLSKEHMPLNLRKINIPIPVVWIEKINQLTAYKILKSIFFFNSKYDTCKTVVMSRIF